MSCRSGASASACWRQIGRLLAGLDNGFNYVVDDEERVVRGLPFNPLRDPSLIPEDELGIPTF